MEALKVHCALLYVEDQLPVAARIIEQFMRNMLDIRTLEVTLA
jgi:hypothetical protein